MSSGRISLLIDSPLRDMLLALRAVPSEASKVALRYARDAAQPIWKEETRDRAETRLQQRVLVDTARVGVTGRNIMLRSGAVGRLSSGTPVSILANAAEFGAQPTKPVRAKSRTGTSYTRGLGNSFKLPRGGGYVVYPALRASAPRLTSVVIQSVTRLLLDALDGKG